MVSVLFIQNNLEGRGGGLSYESYAIALYKQDVFVKHDCPR